MGNNNSAEIARLQRRLTSVEKETNKNDKNLKEFMRENLRQSTRTNDALQELITRQIESSEKEPYSMNSDVTKRGICLIINNESIQLMTPREGAAADGDQLEALFRGFHFEVEKRMNLSDDQIKEAITHICNDEESRDCCVIIILSYGTKETILGANRNYVKLGDIWKPFRNSEAWKGKPKFVFVQTQGYPEAGNREESHEGNYPGNGPLDQDILMYCFYSGAENGRSTSVDILIRTTKRLYSRMHLEQIMEEVQRKIRDREDTVEIGTRSTMNKRLFLSD